MLTYSYARTKIFRRRYGVSCRAHCTVCVAMPCWLTFGETRSYGQIAKQIGSPKAVRAVGAANGKNPISIIAPCHHVIGANGTLAGFSGGLDVKAHF